jgi:hypothetical protein
MEPVKELSQVIGRNGNIIGGQSVNAIYLIIQIN